MTSFPETKPDDDYDKDCDQSSEVESTAHNREETEGTKRVIAKGESRAVFGLKLLVLVVLICATIAAALSVYYYTHNSEQYQFEDEFDEYAGKVLESIGTVFETTFESVDILAANMVSHARSTGQTWPNVTIPDFAYRAAKVLPLSRSVVLGILMVVYQETRAGWEAYTMEQGEAAYNETLVVMDNDPNYSGPTHFNWSLYQTIFGDFGDVPYNSTRPMLPNWQRYPNIANYYPPYNYDYLSTLNLQLNDFIGNTLANGTIGISQPYMLPDPENAAEMEEFEIWAAYYADFLAPGENPKEPMSIFYFPVFDTDLGSLEHEDKQPEVVAILNGEFYWREMFRGILPEGSNGMVIVIESGCAASFTYMLNGPMVEYVGRGDLHETKYSHLGIHSEIGGLSGFRIRESKYTGPDIDTDFCPYTFHMYPSIVLEETYTSSNPLFYALGAVCIFIFASLVFVVYDMAVERRQKIVLTSAEKSSAVVSSLFPETVRDRLMEEGSKSNEFGMADRSGTSLYDSSSPHANRFKGSPIADLYPETTVLFGDVAGFTAWSSKREPVQVFTLLETIYDAFDRIAVQRGVFKVETIGDCYVAVTGLPRPKKHHALVMCRFAAACLDVSARLFQELEPTLGEGTSELSFRFGLHSGPTTAGVLRGTKSRFQLFGDTVNTAARMESNGKPSQIHISKATADLLAADGKGHWVKPREDLVEAKGKGKMQTYWVYSNNDGTRTVSDDAKTNSESDDEDEEKEQANHASFETGMTQRMSSSHQDPSTSSLYDEIKYV